MAGYKESMDDELEEVFNMALDNGVLILMQSQKLLGKFFPEFTTHHPLSNSI
ncbi:hypothetical protein Lalb_Chr11g0067201 [Lupinus albus]|uniref:Uncharacterized protein n=1 Tax=Lupinus albus TaxID=3870 RepID=A0A6A4PR07_LUPAL|nr:hypothetical protein Lalb_Chr11g0067201 [Lupinus albus]